MGRKTYESIGRPLPNRQNIVITRGDFKADGVASVHSLEEAYAAADPGKELFIIGGEQIYRLAIGSVDRIFATEVDATFPEAEVFFPAFKSAIWEETSREHHTKDDRNKYDFDFVEYRRH